ncbi:MAG: 3'(2'),5'-bisphosphate nucleotidase CysQ [Rhizobiales bacterium]|nr:3'(2'),5'-bisphosphate nucleotidase CysQ [Hyphomicrobiales bacterium]MBI3672737.1 3'(2'),5'-bisphosphate nucleotidase CysQ [Hyphomicrobiales bacterium]
MSLTPSPRVADLITLSISAGRAILSIYASDFSAKAKSDLTPVTEADEAAEKIILAGLARLDPGTPVISEEAASAGRIPAASSHFFLVDPLDGTKEFISRNGEFTVNIALVDHGVPVAGVVYAPALGRMFWGELGVGAAQCAVGADETLSSWRPMTVRALPGDGATVVASRSHRDQATEDYLRKINVKSLCSAGSSLKFCLVAAGEADLYPRFGRTMEWDTAAGHAVLLAAGGKVMTAEDGTPLGYGKSERGYDNPGFIASA